MRGQIMGGETDEGCSGSALVWNEIWQMPEMDITSSLATAAAVLTYNRCVFLDTGRLLTSW